MKVLHISPNFIPSTGGIAVHTYEVAKRMKKFYTVEVLSTDRGPENIDGIKVVRAGGLAIPGFSMVNLSPKVFLEVIKNDADVFIVHGYGFLMGFVGAVIGWIRKKKIIFVVHGIPEKKGLGGILQKFYEHIAEPIMIGISHRIISVSKKAMEKFKSKKTIYIPNGVDCKKFECKTKFYENEKISYIGRIEKDKRIEWIVEGGKELGFKVRIVGKDEGYLEKIKKIAEKKGVGVEFMKTDYRSIRKVYCSSKAIVLPSRYEGFPLVWLESVASKRPIFSSRVGDYEEYFKKVFGDEYDRFLFSNKEEMKRKIKDFLDNERKYEEIVERAYNVVRKKYDWGRVVKKIIIVCEGKR